MKLRIVIDRGNTRTKVGLFEGDVLHESIQLQAGESLIESLEFLGDVEFAGQAILSDTQGGTMPELPNGIELKSIDSFDLPIGMEYETPQTLGNDRVANACAAQAIFENADCLIIDAGTCITFDLIANGVYKGGAISPGLQMRYRALHDYTGKLPLLNPEQPVSMGSSTAKSIQSGVYHGTILEMNARIDEYRSQYPELTIILTGGDLLHFENHINCPIFADSNLTLKGLNAILPPEPY